MLNPNNQSQDIKLPRIGSTTIDANAYAESEFNNFDAKSSKKNIYENLYS